MKGLWTGSRTSRRLTKESPQNHASVIGFKHQLHLGKQLNQLFLTTCGRSYLPRIHLVDTLGTSCSRPHRIKTTLCSWGQCSNMQHSIFRREDQIGNPALPGGCDQYQAHRQLAPSRWIVWLLHTFCLRCLAFWASSQQVGELQLWQKGRWRQEGLDGGFVCAHGALKK